MPLASALPLPAHVPDAPLATDEETPVAEGAPPALFVIIGVLAVAGLLSTNGLLTAASLVTLGVMIRLLWRAGEPPVLLFALGYQWLQVTAKVFHADVFGAYIETLSPSAQIGRATWLSLGALVVLAVGMRIALWRLPAIGERIRDGVDAFSVGRAFWVYVAFAVISVVANPIAYYSASLTQILLPIAELKWAAFFLFAYLVFNRHEGYALFMLAFGAEFVQGIGFFSEFKTVFFVALLAIIAARVRISGGTVALGVVGVIALVFLGSAWTVIKPAFRDELSGGSGMQVNTLSRSAQFENLGRLLGNLTGNDLVMGLDPLFRRVAYTDYFALVMDYVPSSRPYDRGALWGEAVRHVLTPRIFFPNKPRLSSDSEVTMRYTGQFLASDDEGTSISIGYVGESYADFGPVGMFGVILLLGIGWGLAYRYFITRSTVPLIGVAFGFVVLLGAYQFEMASIKLLGGVLMKFLVLALLFRWLGPWMTTWLTSPDLTEGEDAFEPGTDFVGLPPTAPA